MGSEEVSDLIDFDSSLPRDLYNTTPNLEHMRALNTRSPSSSLLIFASRSRCNSSGGLGSQNTSPSSPSAASFGGDVAGTK